MLTKTEIRAVRYYIGDTDAGQDAFWSDPKAYVVLNSLFYPGISTELARAREGKLLNPEILADTPRLEALLRDIFSAFRKSRLPEPIRTYRVERFADYEIMKQAGKTISFTSTSEKQFLEAYQDRIGIALMKFEIPEGMPCLVMKQILPDYAKPEEEEALLPPGLTLHSEEFPPDENELRIKDAEGNPPRLSCCVSVQMPDATTQEKLMELPEHGEKAGQHIFQQLQAGQLPSEAEIQLYTAWKTALTSRLIREFLK